MINECLKGRIKTARKLAKYQVGGTVLNNLGEKSGWWSDRLITLSEGCGQAAGCRERPSASTQVQSPVSVILLG